MNKNIYLRILENGWKKNKQKFSKNLSKRQKFINYSLHNHDPQNHAQKRANRFKFKFAIIAQIKRYWL